jgi:hypothetical protein
MMLKWIGKWWRKRQRNIDIKILWPACKKQALTLDMARNVFIVHAMDDPAWTTDFTEAEILKFICNLS